MTRSGNMIYLLAASLVLTTVGFVRRMRTNGLRSVLLDTLAAAALGWIAGLLIGAGARFGMWLIPFFNGAESRFTFDGTLQVILTFSLFGIGLAIVYELFFRGLLRERGILFGTLVTILAAYSLTASGVQQLNFSPSPIGVVVVGLITTALMFIPFSLTLEFLLSRVHKFRAEWGHVRSPAVKL